MYCQYVCSVYHCTLCQLRYSNLSKPTKYGILCIALIKAVKNFYAFIYAVNILHGNQYTMRSCIFDSICILDWYFGLVL